MGDHGTIRGISDQICMALGPLPAEAQHLPLKFTQGPLPSDRGKRVKAKGTMAMCESRSGLDFEQKRSKADRKWLNSRQIPWSPMIFLWETLKASGIFLLKCRTKGMRLYGDHGDCHD